MFKQLKATKRYCLVVAFLAFEGVGGASIIFKNTATDANLALCGVPQNSTSAICDRAFVTFSDAANNVGALTVTAVANQNVPFNPLTSGTGNGTNAVWFGPYSSYSTASNPTVGHDNLGDVNITCAGYNNGNFCNGLGAYDETTTEQALQGNGQNRVDSLIFRPNTLLATTNQSALQLQIIGYNAAGCVAGAGQECPGTGVGHGGQSLADNISVYVSFLNGGTGVQFSDVGASGAISYDNLTHYANIDFSKFVTGANANLYITEFAVRSFEGAVLVTGLSGDLGVPEPSTGWLLLGGMAAVGVWKIRRQ